MIARPTDTIVVRLREDAKRIREDLSAVVLMADGTLWAAADETRSVERLSRHDGRFEQHQSFDLGAVLGLAPGDIDEFDLEGMDQEGDFLWLVGGFGAKRKKVEDDKTDAKNIQRLAKVDFEPDRCLLARVPLVNCELAASALSPTSGERLRAGRLSSTAIGNPLIDALAGDEHLGRFVKAAIPSKDNGLDIEAISVLDDRIFLGLRGPVLRGWSIIVELEVEESSPGILGLKAIGEAAKPYRKHFLNLEGLGIRDLCRDGSDLLILAGPSVLLDGPTRIYRMSAADLSRTDVLHRPQAILDLPHGRGEDHPEGMTMIDLSGGRRGVLVVYDSPSRSRLPGECDVLADVFELL